MRTGIGTNVKVYNREGATREGVLVREQALKQFVMLAVLCMFWGIIAAYALTLAQ